MKAHTLIPIETLASLDASNLPHQSAITASQRRPQNQETYQSRAFFLPNVNNRMLSLGERRTHQTLPAPHAARRLRATGRRRRGAAAIAPILEAVPARCELVVCRRARRGGGRRRRIDRVAGRSRVLSLAPRDSNSGGRGRRHGSASTSK